MIFDGENNIGAVRSDAYPNLTNGRFSPSEDSYRYRTDAFISHSRLGWSAPVPKWNWNWDCGPEMGLHFPYIIPVS